MSDRNQVRRLAEEIQRAYQQDLPTKDLELTDLTEDWLAPRLTTFRAEREAELQAQLHRSLGEVEGLWGVLQMLTRKLREIQGHPSFQGVFQMAQIHGMEYDGPSFGDDLDVAEAAITSSPLSEAAGRVLEAAIRHREAELALRARINVPDEEQPTQEEFGRLTAERASAAAAEDLAVDALLAEMGKGGE